MSNTEGKQQKEAKDVALEGAESIARFLLSKTPTHPLSTLELAVCEKYTALCKKAGIEPDKDIVKLYTTPKRKAKSTKTRSRRKRR